MSGWDSISNGTRAEIGILQVDIAGHSEFQDSDRILKKTKDIFRQLVEGIIKSRDGKLFNWAGDGGSFMFLTGTGEGFEDMVFSAFQVLKNLPAINDEIAIKSGFSETISIRASCDSGTVVFDKAPSQITGDFVNKFLKYEREISLKNTLSITDRVWKQLSKQLKERFQPFKYLEQIESLIYNHGGKESQKNILHSLRNIEEVEGLQRHVETQECVEIIAFKGDTLLELSKEAYQDVLLDGYENVGALNLQVIKNAQICRRHMPESRQESRDVDFQEMDGNEREMLNSFLNELESREREDVLSMLRTISRGTPAICASI